MTIKEELKHAKSELKHSCKILKKRYGFKNPESFMDNHCGGTMETELGYAYYQRGKITILKRLSHIGAKQL